MSSEPTHLPMPDDFQAAGIFQNAQHSLAAAPPISPQISGPLPAIHVTAPSTSSLTPSLIGLPSSSQNPAVSAVAPGQPEFIFIDGVKYYRESSKVNSPGLQHDQGASSRHRFQRLVEELAEACNDSSAFGHPQHSITAATANPEDYLGNILEDWNQSKRLDLSGASTPQAAGCDDMEMEDDGSHKVRVTLIFNAQEANQIDAPLGGRRVIHIAQNKLERILGPETTKAKLPEIRNGSVVLQDVFPTTFNAIRKWLSGKAILHGLPDTVRGAPLQELVRIYVQAARWGHRSIVHDSVNNMPLLGTPFEFLKTCAIVYREGCAGVAFRNFFKRGLPVVLGNSNFDQTEKLSAVLKQSGELAADFAETMLGLISEHKYGSGPIRTDPQPFPAFSARDAEPAWYQPHNDAFCACGLHECTCTSDSASLFRQSDTRNIPRRSGYVETAPPSEVSEETWTEPAHWAQQRGGPGWDHLHRPVPQGCIIPGAPISVLDAEDQPLRPRNWSSAHLRQGSEWNGVASNESGTEAWRYAPPTEAPAQWGMSQNHTRNGPQVQFKAPSQELVRLTPDSQATSSLEKRLREVEKKLSDSQIEATRRATSSNQANSGEQDAGALIVADSKLSAVRGKPLVTSRVPPAPLLHPGLPPLGMPSYVPGYGYNRYVNVGNGVVHPTGPGPYGLAGRTMVAVRDSNVWDCTIVFRAGDVIECVVPVEEGRSTTQHNAWNFSGQRLQGICRTQAGSFPASFAREHSAAGLSAGPPFMGTNTKLPTSVAAHPPSFPRSGAPSTASQPYQQSKATNTTDPNPTQGSASTKVAGNVDNSWLKSMTPSAEPSRADSSHSRSSSTPATAFRVNEHRPGCPSVADWRRPCTCYSQHKLGTSVGGDHAWKPSSAWTNDGWDAPDGGMREV